MLYCSFGMFSFVSLPLVKLLGAKWSLVTGTLCYSLYLASFWLAALRHENKTSEKFYFNAGLIAALVMTTACLGGFGASILWVAQGSYLSECANQKNKGLFNSFFWAVYMSTQIIGNILAAFVIVTVRQSHFYMVVTALTIAASGVFLFLRAPKLPEERL